MTQINPIPSARMILLTIIVTTISLLGYSQTINVNGQTPYRKWDKITISLTVPSNISESNTSFKNNRMDVIFTAPSGNNIRVPGFFAADGNAANSNAKQGRIFKAYLRPNQTGNWSYRVLYYTGNNVALRNVSQLPAPIYNITGTVGNISNTNKLAPDLRAKGRLQYQTTGTNNQRRYLKWAETGEYFLKFGPDSPENMLDYDDFDHDVNKNNCGLCTEHSFNPHASDWNSGDPTWDGGKGKNLIGAVNYLKNQQMNSMSMSLFGGDDKNVFPWTSLTNKFQFDVSKLEQWEIVFDHAEKNGLMLHFKLAEAENWDALTLDQIKVFYREMVARFGHHLGLEWNISEEFGGKNSTAPANATPRIDFLASIDPWQTHRVFHTYPGQHEKFYNYLINNNAKITGASIQSSQARDYDDAYDGKSGIKTWIDKSKDSGTPWVVTSDEQNSGKTGMFTSEDISDNNVIPQARKKILWKGLIAGGAGVMWYGGSQGDFKTENFNRFSTMFEWSKIAISQFFEGNGIEYWKMQNNDALASGGNNRCLAQVGQNYVIYLENGGTSNLNLSGQSGNYNVKWFNPRNGGGLQNGSITSISGGGNKSIGNPPNNANSDWVVLITKVGGPNVAVSEISITPATTSVEVGKTLTLTQSISPNNASDKTVSWSTSNTSIATVNSNGLITGIAQGQATITGTTQNGNFTDSSVITVTAAVVVETGCPFEEDNGLLVIEAESAKNFDVALFSLETGDVGTTSPTGNGYLRYNGPNHFGAQVAEHTVAYKIKINSPGTYRFLWRNVRDPQAATGDAANDAWIYIKGNGARFYGKKGTDEYTLTKPTKAWIQKSEFDFIANGETRVNGKTVNSMALWADFATAGEYTIEYGGRSKGHSVDRIVLFKADKQAAAKNIATPESTQPNGNCGGNPNSNPNSGCSDVILNAIDFPTTKIIGFSPAYIDNPRNAMAINAAQHKDKFAAVKQSFTGTDGTYNITITTLAELDGESTYRIRVGGTLVGTYQNPTTTIDYTPNTQTWNNISIKNGDDIQVEFNSNTNGNIPEGTSTAFSRGRWTQLAFVCNGSVTQPTNDIVDISAASTSVVSAATYTIPVNYTASTDRDIVVALFKGNVWQNSVKASINAGIGSQTLTINLNSALTEGTNYSWRASIRPMGANGSQAISRDRVNFTVKAISSGSRQTPFGGTARSIPGVIQAEDYDEGGQDIAYNDTDSATNHFGQYRTDGVDIQATTDSKGGTHNIGRMRAGEWLEYTVNVTTTQNYNFFPRVASPNGNGKFKILVDGTDISGTLSVSNTGGWQVFENVVVNNISLNAGNHVVRIEIIQSGMNLSRWTAWPSTSTNRSILLFTDIDSENIETSISIYPNPVGNKNLTIKVNGNKGGTTYSINDINGRLISSGKSNNDIITISSNVLSSKSIYILKVNTDGKQYIHKVVK